MITRMAQEGREGWLAAWVASLTDLAALQAGFNCAQSLMQNDRNCPICDASLQAKWVGSNHTSLIKEPQSTHLPRCRKVKVGHVMQEISSCKVGLGLRIPPMHQQLPSCLND